MDGDEFTAPFEPASVPDDKGGTVRSYCLSPTNGRLEWIKAVVKKESLNKGADMTEEMRDFMLAGDKNPMDKPALIIHKTIGGTGDEPWNCFLEGRAFDRETYDNDVESTVFYALKNATTENRPPSPSGSCSKTRWSLARTSSLIRSSSPTAMLLRTTSPTPDRRLLSFSFCGVQSARFGVCCGPAYE